MTPDLKDLWFLPLGGCGEIGMNLNLYGHNKQWLMVDCGITFERQVIGQSNTTQSATNEIRMADPAFIQKYREALAGIVITHAHEDHVGALPYLWRLLRKPVYTTSFTAEILLRKLREFKLSHVVPIHIMHDGDIANIGVFSVEWVAQTHSIPDPYALVIRTPAGSVYHSADWKLEADPVVGEPLDRKRMEALGDSNIDTLVCDSTNANVPGHSIPESKLYTGLNQIVQNASGRVVVACFGTNIARLKTLARIADNTGRHLGLLGRSLVNTVSAARSAGLWIHQKTWVDPEHLGYLPASSVLLVATGSQGETHSALNRMSRDSFRHLALEPGDTVIISARKIPGNEPSIDAMISTLKQRGVIVITPDDTDLLIHASGHPAAEELKQMYRWIKPDVLIPVHGESEHLEANGKLALAAGIKHQIVGRNGDVFYLSPSKGIRRNCVETGRLTVENGKLRSI